MNVSNEKLQSVIRSVVAQGLQSGRIRSAPVVAEETAPAGVVIHASHLLLVLPSGTDGMCVIEPDAACVHCGYCQSFGH